MSVVAVVASGAGGIEDSRDRLVEPLVGRGHRVAVSLTPTAARWLDAIGEIHALESLTGLPVRSVPRLPGEPRPHPPADLLIGAPMSANSVAKLSLGIADNQALTVLNESLGTSAPMIIFPRVNAAHARHPAWQSHLERLRSAGVDLIYGSDVWPLLEPRTEGERALPWESILRAVDEALT